MVLEYDKLCFEYLNEAQSYINQYQEIDMYDAIFEAKNADVEAKIIDNEKSNDGAFAALQKAAKAVMDMIANAFKSIIGGIESLFSSKSDKENFAKIKEAMKNNPALANKKIHFFDFKHQTEEWKKIEAAAADADRRMAAGENVDISGLLGDINRYTNALGKGAVGTVAAQTAINACYGNKEFARTLSAAMAKDGKIMGEISNTIGKREAKKFKREVNSLAKDNKLASLFGKRINLKRAMNKSRVKQCETLEDSFLYTMRQFKHDANVIAAATANTANNADLYVAGGLKNNLRRKANSLKMAKDAAPILKNDEVRRGIRTVAGNKDSVEGVAKGVGLFNHINGYVLDKRKEHNKLKKERELDIADYNRRAAKGDYSGQPLGSFIAGGSEKKRKDNERRRERRDDLY